MRVGIVRDAFANPTDAMTFQEIPGVAMYGTPEKIDSPIPYVPYHFSGQMPHDLDAYDVAELYHGWSLGIARDFPDRTWVTVWDNIEGFAVDMNRQNTQDMLNLPVAGYIARTARTADMLCSFYGLSPDQVYIVPAAVDTDRFYPPGQDTPYSGEVKKILYAGRLTWDKGLTRLVHAMKYLKGRAQLVIAGTGELEGWIKGTCEGYGVDLDFRGQVDHNAIPDLMRECDIFVYPSIPTPHWVEQFGLSAFEAVFTGMPTVVSATGAYLEYGDLFHMVAPEDIHQLVNVFDAILKGNGKHINPESYGHLSSKAVGEKLTQIYSGEGSQWSLSNSTSDVVEI